MTANNNEINVINHLIQVEKDASVLIDDAVKEAEEKLSQSRAKSNSLYKEKYDKIVSCLDEDYKVKVAALQKEHENKVQEYKEALQNQSQNKQAFNQLLDKLLFEKA